MNIFQNVEFKNIDDFLDYLPKEELEIVNFLRELIFENIHGVKEKLAYNVPFYYLNKRILFIWPKSVPWGNVKIDGVQLGFCQGYLLDDYSDYLDKGSRKYVSTKIFKNISEIDINIIKNLFEDAMRVDNQFKIVPKVKSGR